MRSSLFLIFAAVLAYVSAQCSLEGTSYNAGNTTYVFGAAVGGWVPAIQHLDEEGEISVWFVTVRQETSARWEFKDVGWYGKAEADCAGGIVGQYGFSFSADCESLTMTLIYDECQSRGTALDGTTYTKTTVVQDGQCDSWKGVLKETDVSPRLSGERVSIYPGPEDLAIVSIGDYTAIFQKWSSDSDDPANLVQFQDLLSVPEGYACGERFYGQYFLTKETGCGAILCGKTDSCAERAHLFHGVRLNDYAGSDCDTEIEILEFPNNACSDGNIWKKTPYECTGQFGGDQCMFCRGVANDLDVKLCLDRNGGVCNDIFRSLPSQGWCNLEMECPASTLSLSVFALLGLFLVALFY